MRKAIKEVERLTKREIEVKLEDTIEWDGTISEYALEMRKRMLDLVKELPEHKEKLTEAAEYMKNIDESMHKAYLIIQRIIGEVKE